MIRSEDSWEHSCRCKVYVGVDAHFDGKGNVIPVAVIWEDGRRYEIDKVTRIARRASLRAGGTGIRYTCIINGQQSYLFYEGNQKWFVERKTA